ncbi:hypothetical protein OUZ56_011796 [Daphnia magna]|uniref:Uncharacterized protein n=1 Tax=Daphnia magna TaxID=35525 RepID=A0ABQ9Z186_9CRUS|nr:hypothetical protein OUZ56_011796 [Daphnia magna]
MLQGTIAGIEHFDWDAARTNIGAKWVTRLKRFELFALASGVTDNARLRALLIHCGGGKLFDLVNTLTITPREAQGDVAEETEYDATKRALMEHFTAKRNPEYGECLLEN